MGCGLPERWPVDAVTNRSMHDHTAAIPLKFDPYTPRWADSHGDGGRHCLLGISAKDRGARAKLGFILLRRPQAMTPALVFVINTPTLKLYKNPLVRLVASCGFQDTGITVQDPRNRPQANTLFVKACPPKPMRRRIAGLVGMGQRA